MPNGWRARLRAPGGGLICTAVAASISLASWCGAAPAAPASQPSKGSANSAVEKSSTTKPASPATKPAAVIPPAPRQAGSQGSTESPRSAKDLLALERRVQAVVQKATNATVGVALGAGQGSGVIISKDGYVLTAGHVSDEPDKDVFLIFPDGKRVKGRTLGLNRNVDSGLIKITDAAPKGGWPAVELGRSADLRPGQWVAALGHPGGYRKDRPPVLRIGRVLSRTNDVIATDCTLVGGDSGGPLFDLDGRVIGIHSRIGGSTLANMHVPVDTYTETWTRLASGESWGNRIGVNLARGPILGVSGESHSKGCLVTSVNPDGPAAKAGLKTGDVIAAMDGTNVKGLDDLANLIMKRKVGDRVKLKVHRGEETMELQATLARRV